MRQDYEAFIFDLDGTLAVSKSPISLEVSNFLSSLLQKNKTVGIISGGKMSQFEQQFLANFSADPTLYQKLYLMPTCGAAMYRWASAAWQEQYAYRISESEYKRICDAFDATFLQTSFPRPTPQWGEQIEHRDTQITFSAFGQSAPPSEKAKWDAANTKKQEIVGIISPLLPEYSVKAGGMTSVDITHKEIDKKFGIEQFLAATGHRVTDTLFVGDALYEGGNDYAATKTGVDICQVEGPDDLLVKLANFV